MTLTDFHTSGTQVNGVPPGAIWTSNNCQYCHGPLGAGSDPFTTWRGSLMAQAGR